MRNTEALPDRQQIIYYSILLMLLSVLISRAVLSVSLMLFLLVTIAHRGFRLQFREFAQSFFLCSISLLFWVPFVSGMWSSDFQQWQHVLVLKLPLLFLPIAFAGRWQLSRTQWRSVAALFVGVIVCGCFYSLYHYLSDLQTMHRQYREAGLIPTLFENDHVRFSFATATAFIISVIQSEDAEKIIPKRVWIGTAIFLLLFLHVLAARLGLISAYLFILAYLVFLFRSRKKNKVILIVLFILIVVAAWFALPTLQHRINYVAYDLSQIAQGKYVSGTNDGARIYSMEAGWNILKQNPLGVGAGDLNAATKEWFVSSKPQVIAADRFPPMNEWLVYGGYAGWPGVAAFSVAVLAGLFFRKLHRRFYWVVLNILMLLSYIIDNPLEVQYGIFLYGFLLLWWYKWFRVTDA